MYHYKTFKVLKPAAVKDKMNWKMATYVILGVVVTRNNYFARECMNVAKNPPDWCS